MLSWERAIYTQYISPKTPSPTIATYACKRKGNCKRQKGSEQLRTIKKPFGMLLKPASNEIAYLRKHVTKYKHMRKWMVEFLSKSKRRGIEIDRVNSIHITKLSSYCNF